MPTQEQKDEDGNGQMLGSPETGKDNGRVQFIDIVRPELAQGILHLEFHALRRGQVYQWLK